MKKNPGIWAVAAMLVLSVAGLFLGLAENVLVSILFAVVSVGLAVVCSLCYPAGSAFEAHFYPCIPAMIAGVVGAGLILFGGVQSFLHAGNGLLQRLPGLLAAVTALCYVGTLAAQNRGKKPAPGLALLPIVYYLFQMILDFRAWSVDPIILDYCFKLFARIAIMLGVFYLGGFFFDKGKRRITLFFCFAGIALSGISMAHCTPEYGLITGGSALWLLSEGFSLSREPKTE